MFRAEFRCVLFLLLSDAGAWDDGTGGAVGCATILTIRGIAGIVVSLSAGRHDKMQAVSATSNRRRRFYIFCSNNEVKATGSEVLARKEHGAQWK